MNNFLNIFILNARTVVFVYEIKHYYYFTAFIERNQIYLELLSNTVAFIFRTNTAKELLEHV